MRTYIIPRKMSNSGTIYDSASDRDDRVIRFPAGSIYAVVIASYYGARKGYTTHRTGSAAVIASRRNTDSHVIIDVEGNEYYIENGPDSRLIKMFESMDI